MEEWKTYRLSDLTVMKNGKKRPSTNGQYPVYGGNGIMDYSNQYNADNTIIVGRVGAYCGNVYYYPDKCWISDNAIAIAPNSLIDIDYLFYLMSTLNLHHQHIGGAQPLMTQDIIGGFEVRIPERSIQKKIVSILLSLDNKIELNKRINDNLEQQAQAWLNGLFNKYVDNTTVLIHEIAEINPKRNLSKGTTAKCIEMANLPTTGSFPNGWIEKEYNGGMKFRNGDTLIARITPCLENGKTAFINFLDKNEIAYGSTEYIVISAKSDYSSSFFYFLARNHDFVDYAVKNMNGSSGRQRVSGDTIGKYRIPVIPRKELELFMKHAEIALKTIKDNTLQNIRLSTMRDVLLPKLMSGELKVNDLNN